ncbi:MAG: NAD(P)H-dependent oxidoreductase [Sphingomonas sp.]
MTEPLKIHVVIGSVREGRMALPVGNWVVEKSAGRDDIACELVDLKTWDLPFYPHARPPSSGDYSDEKQAAWGAKVAEADGYILIAPEYNHGIPAVLKNALDTVYREWNRKPVSFVAYGGLGGARSVEQLTMVARELQMAPLESALHLMGVWNRRDGDRLAADEADDRRLGRLFDDLVWWGRALATARRAG